MDTYAGSEGQSGLDLCRFGKPFVEWLLEVLGNDAERHSLNADQLLNLLLEELGWYAILLVDELGRVAELADTTVGNHLAEHRL